MQLEDGAVEGEHCRPREGVPARHAAGLLLTCRFVRRRCCWRCSDPVFDKQVLTRTVLAFAALWQCQAGCLWVVSLILIQDLNPRRLAEVDPRRALALRRLREPWRKSCLQLPQLSGRGRRNTHLRSRNLQLARSCLPLCPRSFSSSLCGTRSSGQCAREQEAVPQHGRGSLPARWGQDWHQGGLAGRWSTCRQTLRLEAPL